MICLKKLLYICLIFLLCCQLYSKDTLDIYPKNEDVADLIKQANDFFYSERQRSLELLNNLGEIVDTTVCDTLVARFFNLKALEACNYEGNYKLALVWSKKSVECSISVQSKKDEAVSLQTLGNIYFYQGKWPEAFESLMKAKEAFYDIQLDRGIALTASSLAVIKSRMHQYDQAIQIAHEAIQTLSSTRDTYNLIIAHQNIGTFYKSIALLDSALLHQKTALKLSKISKDSINMAYSYGFLADIFYKKNEIEKALIFGEKSNFLGQKLNDTWLVIDNAKVIADCYVMIGKWNKAEQLLERAILKCKSIGSISMLPQLYERIHKIYARKASFKKAYNSLEQLISSRDSLLSLDHIEAMHLVEQNYEKRIQELISEQERSRMEREQYRQRQLMLLGVIISCIIFFLLAMWLYTKQFGEKTIDFILLLMVLLIFRFLYLFFDPFSLSSMTSSPWTQILISVIVAAFMGYLHRTLQLGFKNQIKKSITSI